VTLQLLGLEKLSQKHSQKTEGSQVSGGIPPPWHLNRWNGLDTSGIGQVQVEWAGNDETIVAASE